MSEIVFVWHRQYFLRIYLSFSNAVFFALSFELLAQNIYS